jgi:hypothetical protein
MSKEAGGGVLIFFSFELRKAGEKLSHMNIAAMSLDLNFF